MICNFVVDVKCLVMKPIVVNSEDKKRIDRTVSKKKVEEDTFEEDWANGISGEEALKQVHQHIENLYASRKKS